MSTPRLTSTPSGSASTSRCGPDLALRCCREATCGCCSTSPARAARDSRCPMAVVPSPGAGIASRSRSQTSSARSKRCARRGPASVTTSSRVGAAARSCSRTPRATRSSSSSTPSPEHSSSSTRTPKGAQAMPSEPNVTTNVLLRSEETGGHVSVTEIVVPPHSAGPPLHTHDFDEAFYMLEGELIFQIEDALVTKGAGELSFAARNVAHTLANHSDAPARYVLVCTPAGFERHWARTAAEQAGVEPPQWALQPIPEVTVVGPQIAAQA